MAVPSWISDHSSALVKDTGMHFSARRSKYDQPEHTATTVGFVQKSYSNNSSNTDTEAGS